MKPYYQDDAVTIYHGDCRESIVGLSHDCDVLITDPPYGVGLGTHGAALDGRSNHVLVKAGYESYDDSPENFDSIVVPVVSTALDIIGRGAVFCAGHMIWKLPPAAVVGGVFLPSARGRNVWGYASLAHCLFYGSAPDLNLGCKATAISSTASCQDNGHPCPKPDKWMRWIVDLASRPGETVLDPFAGSGTTLRAAKDLGRRAIGIEIEEKYCEIAARRCAQEVLAL